LNVIPLDFFGPDIHRMDLDVLEEGSPQHLNRLEAVLIIDREPNMTSGTPVLKRVTQHDVVHRWFLANLTMFGAISLLRIRRQCLSRQGA